MADTAFKQLDFDQDHLIVQTFEFLEKLRNKTQGFVVHLVIEVKGDKASFERLFQEDTFLLDGPFDVFFADIDLQREAVGYVAKEIDQSTNYGDRDGSRLGTRANA